MSPQPSAVWVLSIITLEVVITLIQRNQEEQGWGQGHEFTFERGFEAMGGWLADDTNLTLKHSGDN